MRKIIGRPYRNSFSGPEFPIGTGAFVQISEKAFSTLFPDENIRKYLWISTSKLFIFIQPESLKSIDYFRFYNCTRETGKSIIYWLDTGINTYGEYLTFTNFLNYAPRTRYTTIIKRFCIWAI